MSKYHDTYVGWGIARAIAVLEHVSPHLDGQARYTVDSARANLQTVLDEEFGDSEGGR